jgi:phosphoribosyl 1,2-cyclic phosphodiesterase
MRVTSLGSGSTGNALLVEAGPRRRTRLLVDAGLSSHVLLERLRQVGVAPSQLQGILVTHEHSDHITGLPSLVYRYAIPAIADPRTLDALEEIFTSGIYRTDSGGQLQGASLNAQAIESCTQVPGKDIPTQLPSPTGEQVLLSARAWRGKRLHYATAFAAGSSLVIGDIEVQSFPVSHDAVAPCGYLLRAGGCRVCIAIDSGEVTPSMLEMMSRADLLVIEANHDRQRLLSGPYPYILKQRILSNLGHLSNDQAAEALLHTWRPDSIRWVWLSHLSLVNNTPAIALDIVRSRIEFAQANPAQVHLTTLPPGIGSTWDSTQLWESRTLWEMQG